jgi:hypothetical protein
MLVEVKFMWMFTRSIIIPVVLMTAMAQGARVVVNPKAESEAVNSYYNEAEDRTMTSVFIPLPIQVFGGNSKLEINAHFSYQGRRLSAVPKDVQVVFSVPCNFGSELDSDPVICVDGACSSYRPRGEGICSGGLGRERTSRMIDLPYEAFLRITNGRQMKIKLQNSEVELTDGQVKVLRSLANQMLVKEAGERP